MKLKKQAKLNLILIATGILIVLMLQINALFPSWIKWISTIIVLLIISLSMFSKSKLLKISLSILLVLTSASLLYLGDITNRLFKYTPVETSVISFYVLKTSNVSSIEQTSGMLFGYSAATDDVMLNFSKAELAKKASDIEYSESLTDEENLQKLIDGDIEVLILDNAFYENLRELKPDDIGKIKSIWSIEKSNIKEDIVKEVDITNTPFVVLLSGIDIAGPLSFKSRSDVNILIVVNPNTNKILTISIPRDTYVPLACRSDKMDKLTHSGIYGIGCTVKTIENFLDIDINYYVRLNFTSTLKIVNVIGEIDVYSKYSFTSFEGYKYTTGINRLDADETLSFLRERKSFADGDVQRGLNQQEVIKAIVKKLTRPETVLKVEGIINAVSGSIDTNMPSKDVSKLLQMQLKTNAQWDFVSSKLDGTPDHRPTYSMGSRLLYVMIPNQQSLTNVKQSIQDFIKVAE